MEDIRRIDLHMHSTISDGTDTPQEILDHVRGLGIPVFSITDHDAIKSSTVVPGLLKSGDPCFLSGVEFSCKDEFGKYHILGYGYDPESEPVRKVVGLGHTYRMRKVRARMELLKTQFGFGFPPEETKALFSLDNPGKPHIGNLMVRYGYAPSKDAAITEYVNKLHVQAEYVRPEEAIAGILGSGGIPVLAHPPYGSGSQRIVGREMEDRLRRLLGSGLQGLEAFYSKYPPELQEEILGLAEKYGLYVTAGSDYHGKNKTVALGDTGLQEAARIPEGLERFLEAVKGRFYKPEDA